MLRDESPRLEARGWVAHSFVVVEDIVYVCLGLLLAGTAFTLIATSFMNIGQIIMAGPTKISFVGLLDRILLILLTSELLYTVQVSFRDRALVPEPFLLVGLISAIRRVLVLTAEIGEWREKSAAESQHILIELALHTVLIFILALSFMLLRKAGKAAVPRRDAI